MRCLIRHITRRRSGVTHDDKDFNGEKLNIGRATSQDIFLSDLRVALKHAVITSTKSKKYQVQAQSLSSVSVNNHPVKSARLSVGDTINIANTEIRVAEPPSGYDLALEVEVLRAGAETETALAKRSRMTLAATGITRRPWSWAGFLVVLAMFLILPVSGSFSEGWRSVLRAVPLVSDASWDTGPMSDPHNFIGK